MLQQEEACKKVGVRLRLPCPQVIAYIRIQLWQPSISGGELSNDLNPVCIMRTKTLFQMAHLDGLQIHLQEFARRESEAWHFEDIAKPPRIGQEGIFQSTVPNHKTLLVSRSP
jgi:hypothetical protein